jgi:hypothetical protein
VAEVLRLHARATAPPVSAPAPAPR